MSTGYPAFTVRQATEHDCRSIGVLAQLLWPHHTAETLTELFRETLSKSDAAVFLACVGEDPVGFSHCQLRHDYVEGTDSSPVGYLEGIFVRSECRGQGWARLLLSACERWAKEQGCTEFASDCELTNNSSLAFHLSVGFEESNRIICFVKKL